MNNLIKCTVTLHNSRYRKTAKISEISSQSVPTLCLIACRCVSNFYERKDRLFKNCDSKVSGVYGMEGGFSRRPECDKCFCFSIALQRSKTGKPILSILSLFLD